MRPGNSRRYFRKSCAQASELCANKGTTMKRITLLLVAVVILAGIIAFTAPASLRAADSAAPIFVTEIPPGYRDWRLISVSHEAGNLNSIGAVLGNDAAIAAYRQGKLPYP